MWLLENLKLHTWPVLYPCSLGWRDGPRPSSTLALCLWLCDIFPTWRRSDWRIRKTPLWVNRVGLMQTQTSPFQPGPGGRSITLYCNFPFVCLCHLDCELPRDNDYFLFIDIIFLRFSQNQLKMDRSNESPWTAKCGTHSPRFVELSCTWICQVGAGDGGPLCTVSMVAAVKKKRNSFWVPVISKCHQYPPSFLS